MTTLATSSIADDKVRDRSGEWWSWQVALALAAVSLPVGCALVSGLRLNWLPISDNALIGLSASDIPRDFPLTGVYSRFGFHHPGPLLFVLLSGPRHLFGPKGLLVGAAAINVSCLALILIFIARRGGWVLLAWATSILLLLERSLMATTLGTSPIDPWNPWITLFAFALVIVCAWSVLCRDWWALPVLIVAASFVVQSHLAYAMTAGVLAALVAGFVAIELVRRRNTVFHAPPPRVLIISAACLVVLWVPPLIDQFINDPGNITLIARQMRHPSDKLGGIDATVDVLTSALAVNGPWITGNEPIEGFTSRLLGRPLWTVLPLVALFAVAFGAAWRRRAYDALKLQAMVVVLVIAGGLSAMRITGEVYTYLVRWSWIVAAFAWFSAGNSLVSSRNHSLLSETKRTVAMFVGGVVACLAVVTSVSAVRAPLPDEQMMRGLLEVIDPLTDATRGRGTFLVTEDGPGWKLMLAGFYAELERRGVDVVVVDDEAFRFGPNRIASTRKPSANLIIVAGPLVKEWLQKGKTPVASWDPLSVDDHRDFDALALIAGVQYLQASEALPVERPLTPDEMARIDDYQGRGQAVAVFIEPVSS